MLAFLGMQLAFYLAHPLQAEADQSMYLSMADLLLCGRLPYVDCYDNNPPLIIYLNVIPIVVARAFHLLIPLAAKLVMFAISLLSCCLAFLLTRGGGKAAGNALSSPESNGDINIGWLFAAAILGFATFNEQQMMDLGQREHIFAILYFPYLLLRTLRYREGVNDGSSAAPGRSLAISVGVLAGLGIALKHYFALIALLVEICLCVYGRTVRKVFFGSPENWACAAVIALYLLHFLFLPRGMLEGFFQVLLPIYKAGYKYYTNSFIFNFMTFWRHDFAYSFLFSLIAVLIVVFVESPRRALHTYKSSITPLLISLLAFTWASAAIFFLAGQSWQYHMVPVRMGWLMLAFVESACLLRGLALLFPRYGLVTALAALLPLAYAGLALVDYKERFDSQAESSGVYDLAFLGYKGTAYNWEVNPALAKIVSNTTKEDTVLFLSTAMAPGYPAMIQSERRPGSRFIHGMPFIVLDFVCTLNREEEEKLGAKNMTAAQVKNKEHFDKLRHQFLLWYGSDIKKYKPKLIFIQQIPMEDILRQAGFQKTYMADYKLIEKDLGLNIYKREAK